MTWTSIYLLESYVLWWEINSKISCKLISSNRRMANIVYICKIYIFTLPFSNECVNRCSQNIMCNQTRVNEAETWKKPLEVPVCNGKRIG